MSYENQLSTIKKQTKFTIPAHIYNNEEYNINRRLIILLIASLLEENKDFKKKIKMNKIKLLLILNYRVITLQLKNQMNY